MQRVALRPEICAKDMDWQCAANSRKCIFERRISMSKIELPVFLVGTYKLQRNIDYFSIREI